MTSAGSDTAWHAAGRAPAPSLVRRMTCFTYEAMLLFGIGLIPGALGAWFVAQTGQKHPLQSETALQFFGLVFYGIYFVWFWSARGQTLAMQTWHIRLVTVAGAPVTQARALARYAACCIGWFVPASVASALMRLSPWTSLAAVALGIAAYALLSRLEPDKQFWHDRLCGTRLVDTRSADMRDRFRSRRR